MMNKISIIKYSSYKKSVAGALGAIDAGFILSDKKAILIKPNLINSSPPPVTTPVECVEAIVLYIRSHSKAEIVIAEGSGAMNCGTDTVFAELGYKSLSERLSVPLVDLNNSETVLLENSACRVFKEFHMPAIAMDHYIISVPVLKAHSLADITGSMKNMVGFAPPEFYQTGGHWKKSAFHNRMHESITELNSYRTPDLTVMDATIGLPDYHLGGRECRPHINKIIAGYNAKEVDRISAGLLGLNWKEIPHLA
ncbi:MAG: DUF362 domain-containing protein [Spirochaetes bacterium]|jgi:uncharacterized protein (DUF362 family)|nr:DUF362 domain-containing protein [Spirochaetota bacterium]